MQGVGGGGILQLVNIVVGDITPLESRGKYSGAIGSCWVRRPSANVTLCKREAGQT